MKAFISKIIVFALLFICIDQMLGFVTNRLFLKAKSGDNYSTNYGIRSCKDDILIMGASELRHGIVSKKIADSMDMTCYNLGRDGLNIYFQYAVLNEILKRYKPKIIVVSINCLEESENAVNGLFPYSADYRDIKELIYEIKPMEKYRLFIKSYCYNSLLIKIIQGLVQNEPNTAGYKPLFAVSKNMRLSPEPYTIGISERTLTYFEKFMNLCKNAGCKVYVLETPKYQTIFNQEENKKIKELVNKYNANYISFRNDTTFINHPELYKDKTHLNDNGAQIFTSMVIQNMKAQKN
jgi:hypothetical protein